MSEQKTAVADISKIDDRIAAIDRYLSVNGIKSYDPYDGLLSPLARPLLRSPLLSRIWLQAIRYSPLNIRPMLGIPKMLHIKLISDLASAQSLLFHLSVDEKYSGAAEKYFEQLTQKAVITPNGLGWGLNFPYVTRFVSAGRTEANIFQTVNAIQAFLDGYKYLNRADYLEPALRGFKFLLHDLGYLEINDGICWNYWKGMQTPIYNVNGLMAGLTARLWQVTSDDAFRDFSRKTIEFLLSGQREDGSWPYAAGDKATFIDGFHTGYILEGLCQAVEYKVIQRDKSFDRGVRFYLDNFFTKEYLPKYYPGSIYPVDAQNSAQAIQTLVSLYKLKVVSLTNIDRCLSSIDSKLWNEKGYYRFRKTKFCEYSTPMHRWATGPMFLALVKMKSVAGKSKNEIN